MTTQIQIQGLGEFASREFTLDHDGSESVALLHEEELVSRFSQAGVTEEGLQEACALHLTKCHGWDGCLWQQS